MRFYGIRVQNSKRKDFHGTRHLLPSQFFFYFFCPTNVSMLWRTCVYVHISDRVETVCGLQLLPNSTESETFFAQIGGCTRGWLSNLLLGRRRGGNWANTWRWTKSITAPAMKRCPNENQMSIPFPVEGKLRCFCKGTESFSSHSLFREWTVCTFWQTLIEGNNKCLHKYKNVEVRDKYWPNY